MTVLLLSLAGFMVGRWLREQWEREQDWRLWQAFPPPRIVSVEAPTAAEVMAGVAVNPAVSADLDASTETNTPRSEG